MLGITTLRHTSSRNFIDGCEDSEHLCAIAQLDRAPRTSTEPLRRCALGHQGAAKWLNDDNRGKQPQEVSMQHSTRRWPGCLKEG
jgi:hypothetical protein